jgi:hypothetical protein
MLARGLGTDGAHKDRMVYRAVSGPLAGRTNYVKAWYQEIYPKKMYKVSWMEGETLLCLTGIEY